MELLRTTAAARLKLQQLQFWWCKKYRKPWRDPLLQTYTLEELQIEHLMYAIEEDPQEAYPQKDLSNFQFRTGDPVIDKWEADLAAGKDVQSIDWDAGVNPEFLAKLKEYSKRKYEQKTGATRKVEAPPDMKVEDLQSLVGGFSDDYTKE